MNNAFITDAQSLVTTHEARRAGFLDFTLRRNKESLPFITKAKSLHAKLTQETRTCEDILTLKNIQSTLLDAAGVSTKTRSSLSDEDKENLLKEFVEKVLKPAGGKYVDEIVYRYLMSLGEQLGGKMRNIVGVVAREKLTRFVISNIQLEGFPFEYYIKGKGKQKGWFNGQEYNESILDQIKGIRWNNNEFKRTLLYNLNVPKVSKNIDIVLLKNFIEDPSSNELKSTLQDDKNILAMGELKGGIDPAGADEHWKTGRAALDRILQTYKNRIAVIFVGAAIEKAMAEELFTFLQNKTYDNAANLTNENQLSALCSWLIQL